MLLCVSSSAAADLLVSSFIRRCFLPLGRELTLTASTPQGFKSNILMYRSDAARSERVQAPL
ncbi:hypothetical protein M378DRAFT_165574 [Amanita muscaria Koide BX008]|uniref:Uncharacterized protein n=1 Tax=Amanita muscaria (strain Koide BX008) TaxID=946122 RepID=A0A0C2X0A1_AMAMK|nr:hypothetical protein M378DRAFT_165574 [Amanita muscaria Koide BX008]